MGPDSARGDRTGAGLTNMRDRLDALGGSLTITSEVGRGTTIAGVMPVADAN
jgi:two-component system NarL family sensor kinase